MKPETEEDLQRERKAIATFCSLFKGRFKKLDPSDIDYMVFNSKDEIVAYVEVTGHPKPIKESFPLSITGHKIAKLCDKRLKPIMIWACEDGIIYAKANEVTGTIRFSESELTVFYDKQKPFKYVRYL